MRLHVLQVLPRRLDFSTKSLNTTSSSPSPQESNSLLILSLNKPSQTSLKTRTSILMADTIIVAASEASQAIESEDNLTSFTLFPKFPIELRIQIFGHAMPGARRVRIIVNLFKGLHSDCTVPPMLHVCRESRLEALKLYQPLFNHSVRPIVYFNFARDSLYFGPKDEEDTSTDLDHVLYEFLGQADSTLLAKIQCLTLGTGVNFPFNAIEFISNALTPSKFSKLLKFTDLYTNRYYTRGVTCFSEMVIAEHLQIFWKDEQRGWKSLSPSRNTTGNKNIKQRPINLQTMCECMMLDATMLWCLML